MLPSSRWRFPVNKTPPASIDERHLAFQSCGRRFCIPISRVVQILRKQTISSIIDAPSFSKGILLALSKRIPVVNLSIMMGMAPKKETWHSCLILIECRQNNQKIVVALEVDKAQEIFSVSPTPQSRFQLLNEILPIAGEAEGKFGSASILRIDELFNSHDFAKLLRMST